MSSVPDPQEVKRYVEQVQRKREYNRKYYHERVKPKREREKSERDQLCQRILELESISKDPHIPKDEFEKLSRENSQLCSEKEQLISIITQLREENIALRESLDIARKRNYEIMMEKADQLLPKIDNLTLSRI